MSGFELVMIGMAAGSVVTVKLCALITGDLNMPKRRQPQPRKVRISGRPKECSFEERYPVKRGG
jgi:hypothetical protein